MTFRILFLFMFFLAIQSCAAHVAHRQIIHDEKMLIGTISRDELFSEFPVFKQNYESYIPKDSILLALRSYSGNIHIEIFLGTWCGDSKRNLPAFLKVLDLTGLSELKYTLYALDRTKKDEEGLTVTYSISRVPTMVFLKSSKEIGRITEHPVASVEEDMLSILQQ